MNMMRATSKNRRRLLKPGLSFFLLISLGVLTPVMADSRIITLPDPNLKGDVSLEETISKRRSIRSYHARELDLAAISQLLWSAQGVTAVKSGRHLRAAPSAGALYPMEVYVAKKDGIFRYIPATHSLEITRTTDQRQALAAAAYGQSYVAQAPAVFILCAVYARVTGKYGKRGVRYTDMEAGHIAENIHLQAVALGLGSVPVGAFQADEVRRLLALPDDREPIYIVPVGFAR